jgi:hypothetical protein
VQEGLVNRICTDDRKSEEEDENEDGCTFFRSSKNGDDVCVLYFILVPRLPIQQTIIDGGRDCDEKNNNEIN